MEYVNRIDWLGAADEGLKRGRVAEICLGYTGIMWISCSWGNWRGDDISENEVVLRLPEESFREELSDKSCCSSYENTGHFVRVS